MMNTATRMTRNTVAAIALMTLGLSTTAGAAEYKTVTRSPNSAASIVKTVPVDASQRPQTESHRVPNVITRGPNGAAHLVKTESAERAATTPTSKVITRGLNSAAFIAN